MTEDVVAFTTGRLLGQLTRPQPAESSRIGADFPNGDFAEAVDRCAGWRANVSSVAQPLSWMVRVDRQSSTDAERPKSVRLLVTG